MNILVTGAKGFVGRNLIENLKNIRDGKDQRSEYLSLLPLTLLEYDMDSDPEQLEDWCKRADFVFNLAGVNRPKDNSEFMQGNFGFSSVLLDTLKHQGNACPVMLSSSVQASLKGRFAESEYGKSKLAGEQLFRDYSKRTGAKVLIYRFPNLYGKWCRPNYNSAVATFCNNIANDIPIQVNDPSTELELLYIDDLVIEMLQALLGQETRDEDGFCHAGPTSRVTLGTIVHLLESFKTSRDNLTVPDVSDGSFSKKLLSTYMSYLPPTSFAYSLSPRIDDRGSFTEFLRAGDRGQISINVSRPGVIKGQHWHNTKWEKFLVVSGKALLRMRKIGTDADGMPFPIIEYHVCAEDNKVVEMVPGYTHSITNISKDKDLVTILWCNECFDSARPDTFHEEV